MDGVSLTYTFGTLLFKVAFLLLGPATFDRTVS